jgi:hypothetical protein
MGDLTALLNWSPIPHRIRGRCLGVVIVVTIVEDARALAGRVVVVGAHVLRGAGLGSATGGADSMIVVSGVAAVMVVGAFGSDAASRRASSTEMAIGAGRRNVSSQGLSGEAVVADDGGT